MCQNQIGGVVGDGVSERVILRETHAMKPCRPDVRKWEARFPLASFSSCRSVNGCLAKDGKAAIAVHDTTADLLL